MRKTASEIIDMMMEKDAFSQWLGIKRIEESVGHVILQMQVRSEMVNGFMIAHGGISYALADSAFAFACNSKGRKAVSVETSISHMQKIQVNDVLTAEAKEMKSSYKIGHFEVAVKNQNQDLVAHFKGTVYYGSEEW